MLDNDTQVPWVLATEDRVIGTINLTNIVLGAWRNADLGYWVDEAETGKGLASAAVAAVCELADTELLLHRISASTAVNNAASQAVLKKNGFEQYAHGRELPLHQRRWGNNNLYHRILNERPPGEPAA